MPHDWIDRDEYPFESRYLGVPAGDLHYVDEGSGRPVLMLHGNPTWSFLYRHQVHELRSGCRCVAPDHLGFGLSSKPRDWSYRPADHAENLTALMDEIELDDVTLVLQDWGGPIGLSWAVEHPERVAGVVVINTWAWPVNRDPHFVLFSLLMGGPVGRFLIRRYNFFARVLLRYAFGDRSRLDPRAHEHYLRPLADPGDRRGCMVFPRQILAATPWLRRLRDRLPALEGKPALLAWGMKDIAFRERELRRWQGVFAEARTVRLEDTGHFVQEESPGELTRALKEFLEEVTGTGGS